MHSSSGKCHLPPITALQRHNSDGTIPNCSGRERKRMREESEKSNANFRTNNRGQNVHGTILINVESRQFFRFGGNHVGDRAIEGESLSDGEVSGCAKYNCGNTSKAAEHSLSSPMVPLHGSNDHYAFSPQRTLFGRTPKQRRACPLSSPSEVRDQTICDARPPRRIRRSNIVSLPRTPAVLALIAAALIMVLPSSAPFAEAKKAVLKPLPTWSKTKKQSSQHWQNPVVSALVNFVQPPKKRMNAKIVNIDQLGAAPDSVDPGSHVEVEVPPPQKERKVVQPPKRKKVLLVPYPQAKSAETTAQQQREENPMGQTEESNVDTASQSGYEDDTPGIFLPLPSQQPPAKLRQSQEQEIPENGRTLLVKDEVKEERKRVIKELRKFKMTAEEASSNNEATTEEGDEETVVYYYIPEEASSVEAQKETGPGDVPPKKPPVVPHVVYDKNGNAVPLSDLHDAGDEVYMEQSVVSSEEEEDAVASDASPSVEAEGDAADQSETTETTLDSAATLDSESSNESSAKVRKMNAYAEYDQNMPQAQDQMIIISTVATMALLVGALSARRLRSRQFLSSCIENESLEDDVAYDAAYTHPATSGGSVTGSLGHHPQLHHRGRGGLMAEGAVGYDTFASPGGNHPPPWKGDLEKFDV